MNRDQVGVLLKAAKDITNHSEFVIIGSLSVLGKSADAPSEMVHSIDVDMFPRADPNRDDGEVARARATLARERKRLRPSDSD